MKAIIAAAGWKGAGTSSGLAQVPECFLPLGDGTTTLSRTATALLERGFDVCVAVGREGYPYKKYVRWTARAPVSLPKIPPDFPWDWSPWTEERLRYAGRFGEVLQMPDPGGWSTSLDTLCEAMDQLGEDAWDGLFLACGDMLIPHVTFDQILSLARPFVFSFTAYHSYFWLDGPGAQFFRRYSEPFRRFENEKAWATEKAWAPSHWGTQKLKEAGFGVYGHDRALPHDWTDVDYEKTYKAAREMVAAGKV